MGESRGENGTDPGGSDGDDPAKSGDPGETDRSVRYVVGSLVAGVFIGGVGGGVAFPTLPALGPLLGISPFLVGVILSTNRFTRLLLNAPAGQVLDRVGTRKPMILGFLVMGLAPFGYALGLHPDLVPLLSSPAIFVLSRMLWGVGSAFVFVGAFSTVTHVTTEDNRGKWIGYMRGGQSLGFPTGLVVGGLVAGAYDFETAFLLAGGAGMVAAVVAFAVLPDLQADVDRASSLRALPGIVRADPRIFAVGSVNLLVRFLFAGVLLSTAVLYARTYEIRIGLLSETGVSGVVMAVSVVGASVATVLASRYSDRLANRATVTIPALAVLATGFGILAALPVLPATVRTADAGILAVPTVLLATVLAVVLIGIGVGGTNPPLLAYLGDISPSDDVGKLGGVYNVFGDVGSTLGPVVALPLVETVGFPAGYAACVGLAGLAALLVARILLGGSTDPIAAPIETGDD